MTQGAIPIGSPWEGGILVSEHWGPVVPSGMFGSSSMQTSMPAYSMPQPTYVSSPPAMSFSTMPTTQYMPAPVSVEAAPAPVSFEAEPTQYGMPNYTVGSMAAVP